MAEKFGVSTNYYLNSPVTIQYLIINSKGQINGEQKFKPIVANGEPTFPNLSYAFVGDADLLFGIYDYCIYSGIKEDLEDFKITYESIESAGKVELYASSDDDYIKARGRGNIYITDHYVNEYVGVQPSEGYLYTGYDYDKRGIRNYYATPYAGPTPVAYSTTKKTIYHTVILRQDINASNFENGEKVFALEDDKTIFLHFKRFVPESIGSEVSLFQILDENDNITQEIVFTTGTGFQVKYNGEYEMSLPYDSTQSLNCLIAINKNYISLERQNEDGIYDDSFANWHGVPSNPKIKINAPTVSMPSDWEIGRIAVSDNGNLLANIGYEVFYGPLYD